ncbi:MAG: Hsp20/alpha crystallin family protein [Proteobacteria bacterium]|nr:Hsp20/alpha crystallin family protein [Pseudomonadota bacterium]MDA1309125.1 Hsp20/alpha crystallin family protein [Pseudomonadota bacterium]
MIQKSEISSTLPQWWSQFYAPVRQFGERVAEFLSPNTEAAATKDRYEIAIELPGVAEKDITIEVHGDQLSITGEKRSSHEESGKDFYFSERSFGKFRRSFRLPTDGDTDNVDASQKDGVLTITIPKLAAPTSQTKRITVKSA